MELWLFIIISITALVMAILIGTSSAYLIIRFLYKDNRFPFFKLPLLLFSRYPRGLIFGDRIRLTSYTASPPPKVREQIKFPITALFAEIEHNRRIAAKFSDDKMVFLQTKAWDTHHYSPHELSADLRAEIEQVYADIKLVNKLVWLANELDSQSANLDDYKKLLAYIAKKIDAIQLHVTREYENIIWRPKVVIGAASVGFSP